MTTHASSGIQRPRPPAGHVAVNRSLPRTGSLLNQSPIGAPSKQVLIDLTETDQGERGQDHPAKRLKLDPTSVANSLRNRIGRGDGSKGAEVARHFNPRARPAWTFRGHPPQSSHSDHTTAATTGKTNDLTQSRPRSPPPLPIRPWKYGPRSSKQDEISKSREILRAGDVQTAPYSLEAQSSTPRYLQDKPADFFPWVGNHPEDVLNEHTTKQGHYDRVQLSQSENNSARTSLYSTFKNRPNLDLLSSLFVSALEQRQAHGKIGSASTFKPPPRVTLTDTKRETWLRDLANSSVPLRKLSRTIPHGIRGKSLLEQCLGKGIPIGRALWLSKCVGANEIRAFKRKGTNSTFAIGGETKWVREWTVCVEQFVEGVISLCGELSWKDKLTYVMGLSARLYNEHLLDQDHYLGWMLSSLESSTLDKLPIWLSIVQVYCENLLRYRKTGRQLVEILLGKLRQIMEVDANDIFKPIIERLKQLIQELAVSHPSCFILQGPWHTVRDTLSSCLDLKDSQQRAVLDDLTARNARLALKTNHQGENRNRSVREKLISVLDIAQAPYDIGKLSAEALRLFDSEYWLVRTVVEWSSTIFRAGKTRIYLAVRLLRHWQRKGVDTDSPILDILADSQCQQHLHASHLFQLISELARSRTFAVGRYLQWLMARGALNGDAAQNQRWDVQLLCELPQHRVPEHGWNLRNTLLVRAGISGSKDAQIISHLKSELNSRLPQIFTPADETPTTSADSVPELRTLNWSVKSEVGQWIRKHVSSHYKSTALGNPDSRTMAMDAEVSALTSDEFFVLRDILEELEDISMLADILHEACLAEDVTVLASAADTVCYHFSSLAAIGAHNDLFQSLLDGYRRIKAAELPAGAFIVSLITLGKRIPSEVLTVNYLNQELNRSYQNNAIAACSPVSDHMAGNHQFGDANFLDEFEQFLGTGNRMDEENMLKSFETLSEKLVAYEEFDPIQCARLNHLLSQLRTYNEKQFDVLMLKWVATLMKQKIRHIDRIIPPLLGSGCLTFEALFSVTRNATEPSMGTISSHPGPRMQLFNLTLSAFETFKMSMETVSTALPWLTRVLSRTPSLRVIIQEAYRFRLAQQTYLRRCPTEALAIIREATIESLADMSTGAGLPLQETSTVTLLRHYVVHHFDLVMEHLVQPLVKFSSASKIAIESGIGLLLKPDQEIANADSNPVNDAKDAVRLLNDFSLPFCQLRLELIYDSSKDSVARSDTAFYEVMFETAKSNARAGMSQWIDIVSMLDPRLAQYIREKAEDYFMAIALTEGIFDFSRDDILAHQEREASLSLDIIEEMAGSIPESGVLYIGPFLNERLHFLLSKVTSGTSETEAKPSKSITHWFSLLLRLSLLHRSTFLRSKTGPLDLARLILSICALTQSPSLHHDPTITTFAFDVAACLIDDLPEETRLQTARFLKEKSRDAHLMFLFGYKEEDGEKLQVFQKGKLWPYSLRNWELLEEPTPNIGVNDTAVSLGLFQARKV